MKPLPTPGLNILETNQSTHLNLSNNPLSTYCTGQRIKVSFS